MCIKYTATKREREIEGERGGERFVILDSIYRNIYVGAMEVGSLKFSQRDFKRGGDKKK